MKRKPSRISRRKFVGAGALIAGGAGIAMGQAPGAKQNPASAGAGPAGAAPVPGAGHPGPPPDVYAALGVKPFINAFGTITTLGASIMPAEVVAAWTAAARHFVDLNELADKVGARIADLIGVEAALVTTGAAGALLLGTAGVLTRGDPKLVRRLPDTAGMKNEVVIQKSHHSCYDSQFTAAGAKLVEVQSAADLERAVGDNTAMMFYMNVADGDGAIKRAEWVAFAGKRGIATMIDAAADIPPASRLSEYSKLGFDLVAFSGGKAMRGPNDTGLLVGRRDLIDAAKANASPRCPSIGRGLKVSKEDLVACWAAVERFVKMDHAAERRVWEKRIETIEAAVRDLPTVTTQRLTPPIANNVPHLIIDWDPARLKVTPAIAVRKLAEGAPSIRIGRVHHTGDKGICISVFMLKDGEDAVVAGRVRAVLAGG